MTCKHIYVSVDTQRPLSWIYCDCWTVHTSVLGCRQLKDRVDTESGAEWSWRWLHSAHKVCFYGHFIQRSLKKKWLQLVNMPQMVHSVQWMVNDHSSIWIVLSPSLCFFQYKAISRLFTCRMDSNLFKKLRQTTLVLRPQMYLLVLLEGSLQW